MSLNIAVVGSGGLGSVIGGMLSKAGHRIWLIDHWPDHVQVLKANALRVCLGGSYSGSGDPQDLTGDYRVPIRAYHVYQVVTLDTVFDVVFVGAKAYDAAWMAALIKPRLAAEGYVVSLQGGVDDAVAAVLGPELTVGCAYASGAWLLRPDVSWSATAPGLSDAYVVGELNGQDSPRARDLANLLAVVGPSRITTDIAGARWTRMVFDVMMEPTTAITTSTVGDFVADAKRVDEAVLLGSEAIDVGRAAGWSPAPFFGLQQAELDGDSSAVARAILLAGAKSVAAGYVGTMAQDVARARPTEIGYLNGRINEVGSEHGIGTPANQRVAELVSSLELSQPHGDRT